MTIIKRKAELNSLLKQIRILCKRSDKGEIDKAEFEQLRNEAVRNWKKK